MRIFDFSLETDQAALYALFKEHFRRQNLVPFFGSGFTRGCPAKQGQVPSVAELKDALIETIVAGEEDPAQMRAELRNMELIDVANLFWPAMEDVSTPQAERDRFNAYVENHFCQVRDLPVESCRLLDCRWRYLYTLNYDDAIERASSQGLRVIVPYVPQNKNFLAKKRCLYKLHGDAARFLDTGESKYCILSTKQYLDAMNDRENQAMSQNLETDFSSNNIIFFGCSLLGELDMLFAAGTKLAQGKQRNTDTRSYYVRYVGRDTEPLSQVKKRQFQNFSITDIIEVKAEQMQAFYAFLAKASEEAGRLQKNDSLSAFTGFQFLRQEATSRENIEYLFFSSRVLPKSGTNQFVLPGFFTRRDTAQQMIDAINAGDGHFHVLRGGRLSGKTYVLIDLLKEFQARSTYYFPSNKQISDPCLERLLSEKNAILIFDEHSLTSTQLEQMRTRHRQKILDNGLQVVTAVDRSTGTFTRHYFDRFPEMEGVAKIYSLPSELNPDEAARFNGEFGKLGLLDYEPGWSLLDFMLKIDEASTQKHGAQLPDINIIRSLETLKAMILFTNQESIPVSQGNVMDVTGALYDLCKSADIAIQKDYLSEAELAPTVHDGFRFLANSKYWVYKCLSTYAKDQSHYETIAEAFYEIVGAIQRQYHRRFGQSYYQAVKPYYFFDTIQFTFFADPDQAGSLFLPDVIYKKLLPLFKDDFQFLHQKAKCLLWNSKRKRDRGERAQMLNEALQQITRARRLAEKRAPVNMEYTLYHMEVTKTLILVNNWRYCRSEFSESVQAEHLSALIRSFYDMEQQMVAWGSDSELDEREMQDIQWFIAQLAETDTRAYMLPEDRKTAGHILTLWSQKKR